MYDNTVSARTYLSYIAEQAGGIAVIGRDGKLYIKTIGESSVTLPLKLFKTFKWGEKFKITRVRYDDGIQLFEKGDTTGNTVYISQDNMYIVDQDQINNIYNTLKGLEFYSFEGESIIDPALDTGDIVVIDGKNVIYQGSMQFSGRWIANIESKIQCKAKEETTTRTPSQRTINRRVESNINQIDGKITQLTEETTENTQKITKVEQDVNGITSKVSSVEQSVENITKIEGTAEGKNIYIDDASAEPLIDIMLEGESQQATRSGKNLLDNTATTKISNGITFTVNSDGTVLVDGTNDTSANSSLVINRYDLSPGTYILNGCPSGGASNTYRLAIQETGSYSILGSIDIGNGSREFTIDTTTSVQIAIFIQKGLTINNLLFKPMLRKATIADDTYEPYGASPSPDYRSPIKNVEGKNKFSGWVKGIAINATDGHQLANKTRASSDYIAVDFNQNPNYYLSGLAKTLQTFVAAYNSNKEFLGRTVALLVSYFSLNSSSFIEGTAQGTGDIAYLRATTYENTSSGTTGAIDDVDNLETQLEEGKVATDYVPYNSLEFKDEGKNLFDCANSKIIYSNAITPYERLTNGLKIISSGKQYNMLYFLVDTVENLKGETLTLSSDILFSKEKQYVNLGLYYTNFNGGNRKSFGIIKSIKTEGYYTIKGIVEEGENRDYVCIGLRPNMDSNFAKGDYTIYDNLQVEIGETATPYISYQERKVDFPLSEGQKLMKGSYLADDGIHHSRKQVVLDGTETGWYTLANQTGTNTSYFCIPKSDMKKASTLICDKFINRSVWNTDEEGIQSIIDNYIRLRINTSRASTVAELKTWLSNNPITVEYELAEEEIVPYTETQQEAWEKLRHFTLFRGINNITSTANAKITYVRDNGLSDTYETKRNIRENYYTKSETDSQISQTADSIKESVKEINEQTQEKLATLELANQSLKFATKRVGGNNLIRNSAMINDNNFWLAHAKYPYQESDTPLDNPTEGAYWYCTANSGSYIENQMYVYNSSGWQVSELSRKSLLSAQNYFAYTTSNEYWANGKNANENTLSGRVIKLDGRQDYTVSHIFNITEPITLNQNENKMAISYFIKNSIVQGNVCVGLMFLNEADFTEVEKPYSLYEPGIILTPDDLKDLTKIEQIIEIPKKSDFIPVVVSNTAPTDTTKNWLDTTIYLPKKYNSQTSQWEILDTKMSLYNESSREVWTYRYFYGFYYQTPIIYDTAEIKSCYVALTFYPAFAVYTGNVEPTPYKGLYWNNKTTNLVKRAKYNDTTFVEWEILDIPSSLLPTGASLGVELFDYIVPIKGFVEIADLKLEYNTMCTQWTQFPGEVYGKNYKMDEKGFWIQANQNTMFIDEDEILATYKGINIFQINKDLAYFYKIQATESIEIGNYLLKTQQINSKNMLLLY